MNILVIGATRGIGKQLLLQALDRGYIVTVLARRPEKLDVQNDRLKVIQGDIVKSEAVEKAVEGQDAVCICIGIKPTTYLSLYYSTTKPVNVFSEGTKNVITAMKKHGVPLLLAITGIGAGDSKGHGGFLYDKIFLPFMLKKLYADKDRQESLIKSSGLDWIIIRPGFLTNGPLTEKYKVFTKLDGVKAGKISRADVAHFMLEEHVAKKYLRKTPLLTY
ncbi:MAG: SDR family oxidoreductase [Anaerolineae bacterium]|nr:MAG: SDR family oxidoreductase [Anaerolineae bacterium]